MKFRNLNWKHYLISGLLTGSLIITGISVKHSIDDRNALAERSKATFVNNSTSTTSEESSSSAESSSSTESSSVESSSTYETDEILSVDGIPIGLSGVPAHNDNDLWGITREFKDYTYTDNFSYFPNSDKVGNNVAFTVWAANWFSKNDLLNTSSITEHWQIYDTIKNHGWVAYEGYTSNFENGGVGDVVIFSQTSDFSSTDPCFSPDHFLSLNSVTGFSNKSWQEQLEEIETTLGREYKYCAVLRPYPKGFEENYVGNK